MKTSSGTIFAGAIFLAISACVAAAPKPKGLAQNSSDEILHVKDAMHGFGNAEVMVRSFSLMFNDGDNYRQKIRTDYQTHMQMYSVTQIESLRRLSEPGTMQQVRLARGYDFQPIALIQIFDAPSREYSVDPCFVVDESNGKKYRVRPELLSWIAQATFQDIKSLDERRSSCALGASPQ